MTTKSFPQELTFEILSWLPVKSLIRFRCLSKRWLQLLSYDPYFVKLQLNHSIESKNRNPSLIFSRGGPPIFYYAEDFTRCDEEITLKFPRERNMMRERRSDGLEIVDTCNGMLCVTGSNWGNVYLWNPLTGDNITIPCPPLPSFGGSCAMTIMFGFGFNQGSDEYKVIRIVSTILPLSQFFLSHAIVYTLGTNSWRTLWQDIPSVITLSNPPPHLNGAIHWRAYRSDIIISFDIKDEVFREIPLPCSVKGIHTCEVAIGEWDGLLSLFHRRRHEHVEIWMMEQYGVVDSWKKHFKVGHPEILGPFDFLLPLASANNGEIIMGKDFDHFVLYNPQTRSIRNLTKCELRRPGTCIFKGSLVSPTIINGSRRTGETRKQRGPFAVDDDWRG